jgi:hypothetical protein
MVIKKAKAANPLPQAGTTKNQSSALFGASRKLVQFSHAQAKVVKDVDFSDEPDGQIISINFWDKTCLNFTIEPGFTLKTDYSDFKTGEQRIIRKWRPIRSSRD